MTLQLIGSLGKRHEDAGCPNGWRCNGPRCHLQTGKTGRKREGKSRNRSGVDPSSDAVHSVQQMHARRQRRNAGPESASVSSSVLPMRKGKRS